MASHGLIRAITAALAAPALACAAYAGQNDYDALIAKHAKANHVPAALVHRVIQRESKYRPELVGHGGTIGLMQIKLETAKGLGYRGDAAGLHDADTNLTYGVKYLAGAYRAADGDQARAMRYYAGGYYEAASGCGWNSPKASGWRPTATRNRHLPVKHREKRGIGTQPSPKSRICHPARCHSFRRSPGPVQSPHSRVDSSAHRPTLGAVPRGAPRRS